MIDSPVETSNSVTTKSATQLSLTPQQPSNTASLTAPNRSNRDDLSSSSSIESSSVSDSPHDDIDQPMRKRHGRESRHKFTRAVVHTSSTPSPAPSSTTAAAHDHHHHHQQHNHAAHNGPIRRNRNWGALLHVFGVGTLNDIRVLPDAQNNQWLQGTATFISQDVPIPVTVSSFLLFFNYSTKISLQIRVNINSKLDIRSLTNERLVVVTGGATHSRLNDNFAEITVSKIEDVNHNRDD